MKERAIFAFTSHPHPRFTEGPRTSGLPGPSCQRYCTPQDQDLNSHSFDLEEVNQTPRDRIILWIFLVIVWGMAALSFWLLWNKVHCI